MHSAEWLRGAVVVLEEVATSYPVSLMTYRRLLAEAEAREAVEPGMAEQLAEARRRIDALEDSMNPQDVATVDATLREKAEQLAAAQERLSDLQNERDAAVYVIELSGHVANHGRDLLAARDARMKALGAAEWLRANSNADWLDVDQRDRFKAEAARLEGE